MKKLNAYLYPTPAELAEHRRAEREQRDAERAAAKNPQIAGFENIIREEFAKTLGIPAESIVIIGGAGDGGDLEELTQELLTRGDLLPLSDAAQDMRDVVLEPKTLFAAIENGIFGGDECDCPVCAGARPDNDFIWVTHKGTRYRVRDMATQHIFYSLRMLFNHTVPPVFRVGDFKRYSDVPKWSESYKRDAIAALAAELDTRIDRDVADGGLEQELLDQYNDMKANASVILALGL